MESRIILTWIAFVVVIVTTNVQGFLVPSQDHVGSLHQKRIAGSHGGDWNLPRRRRPQGEEDGPSMRKSVSSRTSLQVLSINFNFNQKNDDDKKDDEDDNKDGRNSIDLLGNVEDEDEEDFSSFIEGLGQWPLYPVDEKEVQKEKQTQESSSSESSSASLSAALQQTSSLPDVVPPSSGRYRGVSPLGNFFRFEAILDMAASTLSSTDEEESSSSNISSKLKNGSNNNGNETYFSSIFSAADQLVKAVTAKEATTVADLLLEQEETNNQKAAIEQETIQFLKDAKATSSSSTTQPADQLGKAAEAMVKDAAETFEYLVTEASSVLSMNSVQDLLIRANTVFGTPVVTTNGTKTMSTNIENVTNDIVDVAKKAAQEQGLDEEVAADQARETTNYVANMVNVANSLFGAGYAYGSKSGLAESVDSPLVDVLNIQDSRPLFASASTARRIDPTFQYESVIRKGAEMGTLAGAVYEDGVAKSHELGHSLVANGTVADVAWMVTDSIDYESSYYEDVPKNQKPMMVRTITIRGFDASDESVDRERILNEICKADGKLMTPDIPNVIFHSGLMETARAIYQEMDKYIHYTSPNHKLVINGHSIGGSLSILLLLLFVCDKGADYVKERVLRVYSHGSPPIASVISSASSNSKNANGDKKNSDASTGDNMYPCPVLSSFGLPHDMVYGYAQPYDPIVRFLSGDGDPLYPLVDDLGKDEVTLYSSGPPRSLRPLARALFTAWDGWPEFRDNWKNTKQNYRSVGVQHILLPEPLRYLNDRFVSTNVGVPPTEAIVRISSEELLPALEEVFPLDVFSISLVPQAVRSFLHHFFPAYDISIGAYATKLEKEKSRPSSDKEKASRRTTSMSVKMSGAGAAAMETNRTFSI